MILSVCFLLLLSLMNFFMLDLLIIMISLSMLFSFMSLYENPLLTNFLFFDDFSLMMWELSMLVILVCLIKSCKHLIKSYMIMCILFFSLMFFCVNDILSFFIIFECSLIPIFTMVIGFGNQPERVKAGQYMMLYTLMGSVPLLIFLIYIMSGEGERCLFSFKFFMLKDNLDFFVMLGLLLAFMVKIPVFLMHSWLPKAHVEAPLEGSMILAGLMLKMGVFGIFRLIPMLTASFYSSLLMDILFIISLMGSFMSSLIALSSDDVKMTVAYSSVSHMNYLLVSIFTFKYLVSFSSVAISVSHGLCSSMLFYLMTFMYSYTKSRSILVNKGFYSLFPSLMMFNFVNWSLNLSAPPSISFIGEVFMFSIISFLSLIGLVFSLLYVLVNSFYSIFNFGLQSHCSMKINFKSSYYDSMYMYSMFIMLFPLVVCFLFSDFLVS